MKKTIIYLGVALVISANAALAENTTILLERGPITTFYRAATPLCMAITKGDIETVRKFIEYGADVNEVSNGMTPLMFAARYNNVAILKLLLENGASLKLKDDKGYTALKHAEISGATAAASFLSETTKK